jgi:hypothetical protein
MEAIMHKMMVGEKEMTIGDYEVVIDDLPLRTKVFIEDVMGKNGQRQNPTSEVYLTKLATGLIHRQLCTNHTTLADETIEAAFRFEYTVVGYAAKLYKYYFLALKELGYTPEDPYKDPRKQDRIYAQVRMARAQLTYEASRYEKT